MGNLKPGVKYIYETVDGVTYAREFGASPSTRFEIGRTYDHRTEDGRPLHDHLMESKLWGEIRRAARTNPALQRALEQCIIIYHLSKDDPTTTDWHPV
jgi:hypothetical protein